VLPSAGRLPAASPLDISPDLADPLRILVVAFACALVDRRWLRWVPRDPR
jgi:hypothetical protein